MKSLKYLPILALTVSGCATYTPTTKVAPAPAAPAPVITIYRHSAWETMPAKGVSADGIRRNFGPEDSVQFKDLSVTMKEMKASESADLPDTVTLDLKQGEEFVSRTMNEGEAFSWNGYRIAAVALHTQPGELGRGLAALEIATIASLPAEVAQSTKAGGPEFRLRVPHEIKMLTLHHSATPHAAGDDLAQKLRNMQAWGEKDRQWWDLPYHYMVDIDGTVLQARDHGYVGDTNTKYNPAGHFLVNCFGNYSETEPNEAQLATIANLFAWAAIEYDIDPVTIFGHKDLAQTACPGDNLYRYIQDGSLKERVTKIIAAGQPKIDWKDALPAK